MRQLILSLFLLLTGTLQAAGDSWQHCASLTDDARRLACYDAFVRDLPGDYAAPPVTQQEKEEAFGISQVQADQGTQLDQISSTVTRVQYKQRGVRILTLANGQVWEQRDSYTRPKIQVGDNITIRRASLGSHRLQLDAGGRSILVRRRQ